MIKNLKNFYYKYGNLASVFAIFIISFMVAVLWFIKLKPNEFYFIHDQSLYFSVNQIIQDAFIRSSNDFGVANGIFSVMSFWNRMLYLILFLLGFSIRNAEFIHFLSLLFCTMYFSFLGFKKFSQIKSLELNDFLLLLISFFYTYNSYTLEIWHTGNYSTTFVMTYALFPLFAFYITKLVEIGFSKVDYLIFAIIGFFMSFHLPLFAVSLFYVFSVLIVFLFRKRRLTHLIIPVVKIALLYIPLIAFILISAFYEYFNIQGALNENLTKSFLLINGGMLSPILHRFSWAINSDWINKSIFAFNGYFDNPIVIFSFLLIYTLIILYFSKKPKKDETLLSVFLFLLLSLFLAKGAESPFGNVFEWLYDNVPFFNVVRSPDSKFGLGVLASTSFLLLYVLTKKKFYYVALVLLIVGVQSFPLVNGTAIRGDRAIDGVTRIITIPSEYVEFEEFLVQSQVTDPNILVIPPIAFGDFKIGTKFRHIGQDLVRLNPNFTTVYLDSTSGIFRDLFMAVEKELKIQKLDLLPPIGVTHILQRTDVLNPNYKYFDEGLLKNNSNLVFQNEIFKLYELFEARPLIDGGGVSYRKISPIKYEISFYLTDSVGESTDLIFRNSYHKGWVLLELPKSKGIKLFDPKELFYLSKEPIGQHSITSDGFFNIWNISSKDINAADNSYILYYLPQVYTYYGLFITLITLSTYTVMLISYKIRGTHVSK